MNSFDQKSFQRSWNLVMIAGALGVTYLTFCVNGAPRTKYLTDLQATPFDFGLLSALSSLAIGFQLLSGIINRHIVHRKKTWMFLCITHRVSFLGILATPLLFADPRVRIGCIVFISFIHDTFMNLASPIWASWMADILPKESLSRQWAKRQRFTTLWSTVATLGMAVFFEYFERNNQVIFGYTLLGIAGVILGIIDVSLFTPVPEPPYQPKQIKNSWRAIVEPLKDPQFRPFLIFRGYWQMAAAVAYPFFFVYMIQELKISAQCTQLIFLLNAVGIIVSTRLWGLLCDTYGQRPVMLLLVCGKMMIPLMFVLLPPDNLRITIPLLCVSFFCDGILNSAFDLSNQGIILKTTPRENRAMYVGANNFFAQGIPAIFPPIIAGWVIDKLNGHAWHVGIYAFSGYHLIFLISSIMRTFSIPLAMRLREPGSVSLRTMLSHVWAANPLPVARHVYRLSDSPNAEARAKAAQMLGKIRSPLAIRALIKALEEDTDKTVRHRAAEALGHIGSSDACESLAGALTDPTLGIQSPAAHALGEIGGFDSLHALLKNLKGLDKDALRATVDSLGKIGDPAAILPLICLMDEQDDPGLQRHIANALTQLTPSASEEEVMVLFSSPNPTPRRKPL
jgi:MFS family permease